MGNCVRRLAGVLKWIWQHEVLCKVTMAVCGRSSCWEHWLAIEGVRRQMACSRCRFAHRVQVLVACFRRCVVV